MHGESKQFPDGEFETERVIVLQLLRNDRPAWWSRADVLRELHSVNENAIRGSLEHLGRLGVLDVDGERVRASDALRHIDSLCLLCI